MNYIESVPNEYVLTGGEQITYIPSDIFIRDSINLSAESTIISQIGTSQSMNVHFQLKDTQTLKKSKEFNPISIEGNMIKLSSERMEIGQYYPTKYLGKRYLFHKPKGGIIDIYEVAD